MPAVAALWITGTTIPGAGSHSVLVGPIISCTCSHIVGAADRGLFCEPGDFARGQEQSRVTQSDVVNFDVSKVQVSCCNPPQADSQEVIIDARGQLIMQTPRPPIQ